jgi:CHRD domain/PEP-CTERM motif
MRRLLCFLALAAFAPGARADVIFQATLLPGNEVPPNFTQAFGFITVDLHTDLITLDVNETFSNLTAPASMAHIHCCTPVGVNAPVVLPFPAFPAVISGSYSHTFNLTTDLITGITPSAFVTSLEMGDTYANIHDSVFPGGEIRGQLSRIPEPGTFLLMGGCLLASVFVRRRLS